MSRVHRVAWRMEKPGRVTAYRVMAAIMLGAAIGYGFNLYTPGRWTAACFAFALALSYWQVDLEARAEYWDYRNMKALEDALPAGDDR